MSLSYTHLPSMTAASAEAQGAADAERLIREMQAQRRRAGSRDDAAIEQLVAQVREQA